MSEPTAPMRPVSTDDYRAPENGARPRRWVRLLISLCAVSIGLVAGMFISGAWHL